MAYDEISFPTNLETTKRPSSYLSLSLHLHLHSIRLNEISPEKKKTLRDLRRFEIETRASTPNDNTKFSSTRGERRHPGAPFISHNFPINAIKPSLDTGLNLSFQPGGGQNSGIPPRSSINPARHDSSTLKGRFYQSTLFVSSLLRGPMYFYDFQILSKRVGKYVEVDGVDT